MSSMIGGLILLVLGIWGVLGWWEDFGSAMRGFIPFVLIILGFLSIASKYYNKKNSEQSEM